ncbi:hypothetical protein [Pseudalkalibacillus berkeleyi]|uniref:Uncharacterized protein n=1 Tax=Pseudalkalibacillus berkeleyi TaxID=1069813 RepID=A0ABS9GW69_9BACL|nr:hypothetical protein [Pseudalkalibacillus berkeleyi]MCF6136944.1 hypothetical protein [Pseudalkalibacillus berkeleyi]
MYIALILSSVQLIIWSFYALVTYLSHRDPSIFEYILLGVFCYFGYLFGVFLKSPKVHSGISSFLGAGSYLVFHHFIQ